MKFLGAEFARKFKKEKRLRPGDYDFINEIYPSLKERPRFKQVTDLIETLDRGVSDKVFSDSYTNHYFIHCHTLNDGLTAAVAICNMIYKKYIYEIGDYLVDMGNSGCDAPVVVNASIKMLSSAIMDNSCENFEDETEIEDEDELNAGVFLYNETSLSDIFAYDSAGIRICFVIYAEDKIKHDEELMPKGLFHTPASLPPQQAAMQLHYTYINIPADKRSEIAEIITDQITRNGFNCENVKKQIKALSQHPLITDEYKAVAAAKHIINTHIQSFNSLEYMLPIDFRDYVQVETKKTGDKFGLVGLENELRIVKGTANSLAFDIERRNRGLTNDISGCNMIFAGQPGTAKTTMAREFAKILADKFIIPGIENFRECKKSDIVGQYVGHTAKKVDDMFKELADKGGGVIFFDEIYTLSEKNSTCYDTEAINCITQNMENYRTKVFCIFAGYENKMKEFIEANPGLSSRISTSVKFMPYDDDTLCKIFESMVKADNFVISGEYYDTIKDFFNKLRAIRKDNFGNGREARNLFENAKRFTANRVMQQKKTTKQQLSVITSEDITSAVNETLESMITGEKKMNAIGF